MRHMDSLEYTMEATSREEGVAIDLPPQMNNNDIAKNDDRCGDSDSPLFDDEEQNGISSIDGPNYSTALDERREVSSDSIKRKGSKVVKMVGASSANGPESNNYGAPANNNGNANGHKQNGISQQPSSSSSKSSSIEPSYYTSQPNHKSYLPTSPLTIHQRLREYRHTNCIMTPFSTLVLLAILLSSFITLLLSFPQLIIGILLGPLVKRNFWLVEFLYRYDIARWGHLKIMTMAGKSKQQQQALQDKKKGDDNNKNNNKKKSANKKLGGHSSTIKQRITIVPDRVYVHPIPQFMDNIAYLIVCTPPPSPPTSLDDTNGTSSNGATNNLPILGILIDCGESTVILQYMEYIYGTFYANDYPQQSTSSSSKRSVGIELYAVLCTHRHHDHTAGVGSLVKELIGMREVKDEGEENVGRKNDGNGWNVTAGCSANSHGDNNDDNNKKQERKSNNDIYQQMPGNVLVVGGAVEQVPHCNLFVKNGCFIPLPCISSSSSSTNEDGSSSSAARLVNDMNAIVSIEVIGVPSHTRGSVVYALRNRVAPNIAMPLTSSETTSHENNNSLQQQQQQPLQSHLFTGDAIFTGGGGVPFEADLEFGSDNFIKNAKSLKSKNGSSTFRPGAGTLSMERCFTEVLTRAKGPWSTSSPSLSSALSTGLVPQAPMLLSASDTSTQTLPSQTLLYPGHEYTTDLLMRQFDQKVLSSDIHWNKTSPSTFFEVASHYLVSAHRRGLPLDQKLLTVPTPLEQECVVNPNFRMLKKRGESVVNALNLWYEFGTNNLIPDNTTAVHQDELMNGNHTSLSEKQLQQQTKLVSSVFTTLYSSDLQRIIKQLRSGSTTPFSAANQLESLHNRLDEKLIGRRPIPRTLPSHKNVYLSVVALAMLGSAPSAVTLSDANIMNMAPPVECTDRVLISKSRLIAALDGLGLLSNDASPRVQDIINLLWKEARLDNDLKFDIEHPNGRDIECSIKHEDEIELGLLKLALFGVTLDQGPAKFCLPCIGSSKSKPKYNESSWVKKSKLRRTNGELVRHDAENCLACRDVLLSCPYSKKKK